MLRVLRAIVPGADNWLWRRLALLGSVATLLYCIVGAAAKGDAATVAQLVIGLIAVLGIYTGGRVADDHLKRQNGGPTS